MWRPGWEGPAECHQYSSARRRLTCLWLEVLFCATKKKAADGLRHDAGIARRRRLMTRLFIHQYIHHQCTTDDDDVQVTDDDDVQVRCLSLPVPASSTIGSVSATTTKFEFGSHQINVF